METEVNVQVSYFHCRTDDDHRLYTHFPTTGILDICRLWILVALWELCTCTDVGCLFVSHRQKSKELTGVVYLPSREFLLQARMFVKYTSRVNIMTLIHLVPGSAQLLARFTNTPLVERGLRDLQLSSEWACSSIIGIWQRSSHLGQMHV